MLRVYGPAYVARYLGVSDSRVHQWCRSNNRNYNFPLPDVEILGPDGETATSRGWSSDTLSLMRPWYESHRNLTPPAAKKWWQRVDANRLAAQFASKRPAPKPQPHQTAASDAA